MANGSMALSEHLVPQKTWGCPQKWDDVKPQFLDYEPSILTNMNTVINPLIGRCKLTVYLVGGFNLPSWKIWIRQWEGWHPIYVMENNNNVPNHQPGLVGFPKLPFLRRTFDFFSTDASIHWALPSWQHKSSASHNCSTTAGGRNCQRVHWLMINAWATNLVFAESVDSSLCMNHQIFYHIMSIVSL